jgi:hypothetical protein
VLTGYRPLRAILLLTPQNPAHLEMKFMRGYINGFKARQAARMRLPVWLGLLMPLMSISSITCVAASFIGIFWLLHRVLHPGIPFSPPSNVVVLLIILPSYFGAIAPALMLLNFVLARISPLKRIFDKNSEGVPGASYKSSMRGLGKAAIIILPATLALSLLGAIDPWAL